MKLTTRRPALRHVAAYLACCPILGLAGSAAPPATDGTESAPSISQLPTGSAVGPDDDWRTAVSERLRVEEYGFRERGGGVWSAGNRRQGIRTRVGPFGLQAFSWDPIAPGDEAEWRLHLRTASFGRAGRMRVLTCAGVSAAGVLAKLDHGDLVEWFVNDEHGIEQGWTIAARPEGDGALSIVLTVQGDLSPELAADGASVCLLDRTGERRAEYAKLVARDATGRELPAWLACRAAEIEVRVDDAGATYPIIVDPQLTNAAWSIEGDQAQAAYGISISSAGDVNGDGFPDVVVGAGYYTAGELYEGRVYLYLGTPTGLSTTESWTAESNQIAAHFGLSVSGAGDVNGDGYSDVIVGAPEFSHDQDREGRAYVYHGSAGGLEPLPAWVVEGDQTYAYLGWSVAHAGDVNGDGYADVIVGVPGYSANAQFEGGAFVYHGSPTGLGLHPAWIAESDQAGANMGISVAGAGDVNGDGYADVIVGAYKAWSTVNLEGRAFVYHGSATGLEPTEAWSGGSSQWNAWYGFSVSTAGDVDADGYADVIVGAPRYDTEETDGGRAYLYRGSPAGVTPTASWVQEVKNFPWFNSNKGVQLGYAVSTAGDLNGDGYADVIVGAPEHDHLYRITSMGRAYAYYGSAQGLLAPEAGFTGSSKSGTRFGKTVAAVGDVNGDGFSDVMVGSPSYNGVGASSGRIWLYHGVPETLWETYCTAGTAANGCAAQISAEGFASATEPSGFVLVAKGADDGQNGLFFFGANGRQAAPWGNGTSFQCVVPPLVRGDLLPALGPGGICNAKHEQDLDALWCPGCPKPAKNPGAGAVVQAQFWYMDPLNTSNHKDSLSDAIEFTVGP